MYYYCKACGPDKASKLNTCNKLAIGCGEELVCPTCSDHLNQAFVRATFSEFNKAILPNGETIASKAMNDLEFDDEPLVGEGADDDIYDNSIQINSRVFECEPGYPYACDFTLSISLEAVMRGESIQAINQAYIEHGNRSLGHRCNLVEVNQNKLTR